MARTKMDRNLTFKPKCKIFSPIDITSEGTIALSHDELEALYLMDFLEQYQEDCAKSLGVSRPTFSRIIHNARKKTADMIVSGKRLVVREQSISYDIAFPTDDKVSVAENLIIAKYFAFINVYEEKIASVKYIANPIVEELEAAKKEIPKDGAGLSAGRIIPEVLKGACALVCKSIGEGLKRNLEGVGISVVESDYKNISEIEINIRSIR